MTTRATIILCLAFLVWLVVLMAAVSGYTKATMKPQQPATTEPAPEAPRFINVERRA